MVHNNPVVEVVQGKTNRKSEDRNEIQPPRVVQNHTNSVPESWFHCVNVVLSFVKFQGVDRKNKRIFDDGAENHENTRHDEAIDGVEFCGS